MLWFDSRFGLFIAGPSMILSLFGIFLLRSDKNIVPNREIIMILVIFLAVSIFFSSVQYSRIQYYTGIRYMTAIIPLLYIVVAAVLIRIPKIVAYPFVIISLSVSLSIAMVRSQESILDSIMRLFLEGFQLPWMNTLSKMATQYIPRFDGERLSVLPVMVLTGALIYGVWAIRSPAKSMLDDGARK